MWWCFGILYVLRLFHGSQVLTDTVDDLYISNSKMTYQNTTCPNNGRILSYSDVTSMAEVTLTWHDYVWINASGTYTPWMEYNGTYIINRESIKRNVTIFKNGKQLLTCVNYCYKEWVVGLQEDTCFCLAQKPVIEKVAEHANICPNSTTQYTRCAERTNTVVMAVYNKASRYTEDEFGDCLIAETNITGGYSVKPTDCSSVWSVQCFNKTGGNAHPFTREQAEEYCSAYGGLPARRHFAMEKRTSKKESFWLSEIRVLYYLQGEYNYVKQTSFPYYCVSGQNLNGRITLHLANCRDRLAVICIKPENDMNISASEGVYPDVMITSNAVGSTTENSNEGSNLMVIIMASVGGFVLLVIIIAVIILLKRRRQTAHTSEPVSSAVYASVQKTQVKTSSEPCTSNTSKHTGHNDNKMEENNDPMQENTYDHTNFTLRQSVQQPDVSNYDTMESVQMVGESIYSRSDSVRTTGEKAEFVEDDSIYNQTFVVEAKKQSDDEQVPALTDSSSYQ